MTARLDGPVPAARTAARDCALLWIDAEEAIIVRWRHDEAHLERLRSDVPGRRRSTGHVRHDPRVRHGGGGTPASAGEPRRLDRLRHFVEAVAGRLAPDEDVVILGPGTVRRRLETTIREADWIAKRDRAVTDEAAPRLTDGQLIARLRETIGAEAPRRGAVRAPD